MGKQRGKKGKGREDGRMGREMGREGGRDKRWGRWGGKIGVRNNYLHSHIRIFKGEQKTFREIYFSEGVRDSFWSYFIPSVARDEMGPKRVENPRGKVNLKVFCSHEKILI